VISGKNTRRLNQILHYEHYDGNISLDLPPITIYCRDVQIFLPIYFYIEIGNLKRKSEPINEES
jgi:hypothetical protein